MRRFFTFIVTLFVISSRVLFAEEQNVITQATDEIKEMKKEGSRWGHFGPRLNLAPVYQGVGIGWRIPTFNGRGANDFSLSCNGIWWLGHPLFISSVGYAYIHYRPKSANLSLTKYIGYGCDLCYASKGGDLTIFPNPKISWGTKYDNDQFSEWTVNIIPTAAALLLIPMSIGYSSTENWGLFLGMAGLVTAIEYHYGF